MSEHDLHDLDVALRELERDITVPSHPGGAALAVRAARRRRGMAGVGVAIALTVGGTMASHGFGHDDVDGGPASGSGAPWDAETLSTATQGWESSWQRLTGEEEPTADEEHALSLLPTCWLVTLAGDGDMSGVAGPARRGQSVLATPSRNELAVAGLSSWSAEHVNAANATYANYVSALDSCQGYDRTRFYTADDALGKSWTVTDRRTGETLYVWVMRTDRAVGVLAATGSAGPMSPEVQERVASAFGASLAAPASYSEDYLPDSSHLDRRQ